MKKSKRLSKSMYITNCFIILLLVLLIGFMTFFMDNKYFKSIIKKKPFYVTESRVDNIKLSKKNDTSDYDTYGWIKVQNTSIDMPILKNNVSFSYPVEREKYVWVYNDEEKYYNVLNIFGHNIYNLGSNPLRDSELFNRLEALMGFVYPDVAEKSKYMQLTVDGKEYVYKIFAASFISETDIRLFPRDEYTKAQKEYQLDIINKTSIYDYDVDVTSDDDFITLSTCTRFLNNGKFYYFLVAGRLVSEDEELSDYSVVKNENYDKVEKILKGDDHNEESV